MEWGKKVIKDSCPKCNYPLRTIFSGNMKFRFCSNPNCDYFEPSELLIYSQYRKLPAPFEEVQKVLENEKREAEKNIIVIGTGTVTDVRFTNDNMMKTVTLNVNWRFDVALRPYDSVYFGNALGVVVEQSKNQLTLLFDATKGLPERAPLKIAEPVVLYESALSIIEDRSKSDGKHISLFVNVPGLSFSKSSEPSIANVSLQKYDLDEEKEIIVKRILRMAKWDYISIEGPPGTGKTMVISVAASEAADMGHLVLITSHTNVAVDNALERLIKIRPDLKDVIARIGHPAKVSKIIRPFIDRPKRDEGPIDWLLRIFDEKRIIGITIAKLAVLDVIYGLNKLSSHKLKRWPLFDFVFIDEASVVPFCTALIPIYYGKRWIILGDLRQLPPIVKSSFKYVGALPLMELIIGSTHNSDHYNNFMLTIQRRGNKRIFDIISKLFYQNKLKHHQSVSNSHIKLKKKVTGWIGQILDPNNPLVWIDIKHGIMEWCKIRKGRLEGASGANPMEAAAAVKIYLTALRSGIPSSNMAIITTYRAQANLIYKTIREFIKEGEEPIIAALYHHVRTRNDICEPDDTENLLDLRISETVDSYQGREKEIIIYSITSHFEHKALLDYRRINVAFTRARSKLIIISSLQSTNNTPWFKYIKRKSHIIEIFDEDILSPEIKKVYEIHKQYCRK